MSTPTEIIDTSAVSGRQILIIILCLLFNMVDGFDITAMAIVAQSVGQELSLSAEKLGWIFSMALAGMMAGAMLLAPLSDVFGRRKMIISSLVLVGSSIVLTANATSLTGFMLLRFISGLGAGCLLATQATLASEYSPERFRTLAVSAVTAGYPIGAMMTSVVAAYLIPEYGWRGMFWFGGVMTLLMACVAFFLIPESLKFLITKRSPDTLEIVNQQLAAIGKPLATSLPETTQTINDSATTGLLSNVATLLSPEQRRTTILLWFAFFLSFATLYVLMSWIPKMIEDSGYDFSIGRDAFFLFNLGGVIGIFLMGAMSTRCRISILLSILLIGSAAGMVIFALISVELSILMLIIFLIGLLQQGGFTGLYAAATKSYPTEIRATGVGWCIGLGRSGAVFGPTAAGYLMVAGSDMSEIFLVFAIPMLAAGVIAYFLKID